MRNDLLVGFWHGPRMKAMFHIRVGQARTPGQGDEGGEGRRLEAIPRSALPRRTETEDETT